MKLKADDAPTIYALASGGGRAGVAIVRVSGGRARFALETIVGDVPKPRVASLRRLKDADGYGIDDALVLWFPAPRSFTGEDCAEFHVHGGRAIVAALLASLASLSVTRLAEPGEFSRRAFLNGKLDLAQAEGLADLIDAETEAQRRQALYQLDGALGVQCVAWRQQLIALQAGLEAEIDFSDEGDVGSFDHKALIDSVTKLSLDLKQALSGFVHSQRVRQGLIVVITGAPNVGKSSLLNAIAQRDAAIVSSIAGTTRDLIEVSVVFFGELVTFVDTAGIRETSNELEELGISRARLAIDQADLVIELHDSAAENKPVAASRDTLRVATKRDLVRSTPTGYPFWISTKTGDGLPDLFEAIRQHVAKLPRGAGLITRQRHAEALKATLDILAEIMSSNPNTPVEVLADDLRLAGRELGRLVGHFGIEDVLGSLFSSFCIGK